MGLMGGTRTSITIMLLLIMLIQKTWKQTSIGTKLVGVDIHKKQFPFINTSLLLQKTGHSAVWILPNDCI